MVIKDFLKRITSEIGEFFGHYLGGKVIDKAVGETTKTVVSSALKARFMGIGENDEALTLEAAQIAHEYFKVSPKNIARIMRIFKKFSIKERNKITNILGRSTSTETIYLKNGVEIQLQDKNIRGAKIIFLLSKMTNQEIKDTLSGSGAEDTTSEMIEETGKELLQTLQVINNKTGAIDFFDDIAKDWLKELKKPKKRKFSWLKEKLYR